MMSFSLKIQGWTWFIHYFHCYLGFRLIAVPVANISRKYLKVDVSSGTYISSLPNPYEKD